MVHLSPGVAAVAQRGHPPGLELGAEGLGEVLDLVRGFLRGVERGQVGVTGAVGGRGPPPPP